MKTEYKETAKGGEAYTWDMDELETKAKIKRGSRRKAQSKGVRIPHSIFAESMP